MKLIQLEEGVKVVGIAKIHEEDVESAEEVHPDDDIDRMVAETMEEEE